MKELHNEENVGLAPLRERICFKAVREEHPVVGGWTVRNGGGRKGETESTLFDIQIGVKPCTDAGEESESTEEQYLVLYVSVRQMARIAASFFEEVIDLRERPIGPFTIMFKLLMWRRWSVMTERQAKRRGAMREYLSPSYR